MMRLIVSAFLMFLSFNHGRVASAETCKKKDIMVVIELPTSQRYAAFFAKNFIQNMKRVFNPSKDCQRIGFIFSWAKAQTIIPLDCDYNSCYKEGIRAANDVFSQSSKLTGAYNKRTTADALRMAAAEFIKNDRKSVEKLLILALSTPPSETALKTEDEVKDLLDLRIKIMAIGVGEGNQEKLAEIASESNLAIEFETFRELSTKGGSRIFALSQQPAPAKAAKRVAGEPGVFSEEITVDPDKLAALKADSLQVCENRVDIAFIVDSSGSVKKHFEEEKFFVKRIATRFGISKTGSHAGVIVFSSHGYINTIIKFNDYLTTDSFNEAVQNLPFYGYMTRIDKALQLAHKELFSGDGGSRPGVRKLLFLITDGKQNPDFELGKRIEPAKVAERLHLSNVQVYSVAIGPKVNMTELNLITKDPKKVYPVIDFKQLTSDAFVANVSKQLCKGAEIVKNETTVIFPKKNCTDSCKGGKCGECGCCGNRPVYVNIFQGSNSKNYVNQGQTVVQSGSGNSAGALGESSGPLTGGNMKAMSNEEIVAYVKKLIPYFDSLNGSLKELLTRTIINKRKRRSAEEN